MVNAIGHFKEPREAYLHSLVAPEIEGYSMTIGERKNAYLERMSYRREFLLDCLRSWLNPPSGDDFIARGLVSGGLKT